MPYITHPRRAAIDAGEVPQDAGELNYALTILCLTYYRTRGRRYQQINDVMGALHSAGGEFYRRVASSYEDGKIRENGDVYPPMKQENI